MPRRVTSSPSSSSASTAAFGLLAEGLINIDEKLDRETADIRGEMRRGFADTHELIKFTWSHLG